MHAKLKSELIRLEPRLVNERNNPDGTCRSLVLEIIAEHIERTGRQEITLREIQQAVKARGAPYSPNTVRQVVARDMAGRYTNYSGHVWCDLEEVATRTFRLRRTV